MKQLYYVFLGIFFVAQASAQVAITSNSVEGKANYFTTEHSTLYYESYGSGAPLLILHGNGGSTKSMYRLLPDLIPEYEVIAIDSPCHGQSSCNEELLSFEFIAEEIGKFIDELGYEKMKIWGHSDGGIVALMLGYTIPEKIDRMLVSGANTRLDTSALIPEIVEMIHRYDEIAIPEMRIQVKLMAEQNPIPDSKIKEISVPTTLMVGDRDAVRMEHTLELFSLIPHSNLCVLPGTSHFLENPGYIVTQLKQLNQPFRSPSTLDIVEQLSKQVFLEPEHP